MTVAAQIAHALAGRRVAWVAPDLGRTLGLAGLLPEPLVVCQDAQGAAPPGLTVVEVGGGDDELRGSLAVLSDPAAVRALRQHGTTDLLLFKVNARLVARAAELGLRVLAGAPAVAMRFEHKLHFARLLRSLGVPAPETRLFEQELPPWGEMARALGEALVVQAARGHSGQGTHLVRSEQAWEALRRELSGRGARVSPLVDGTPLTVNGCATEGGASVGRPYAQLTGVPGATPHPLGACGNAFEGSRFDVPALRDAAARIGHALAEAGYRGIYGIDAILDPVGDVHVIEVNPRMISGSSLETLLQSEAGGLGPAAAHILALAGEALPVSLEGAPVTGGQVVLYSDPGTPRVIASSPGAGRFRLVGDALVPVDGGLDPTQCAADEVILLPRSAGRTVPPTGEIARVQTPRLLLEPDRPVPEPLVHQLIAATRKAVPLA